MNLYSFVLLLPLLNSVCVGVIVNTKSGPVQGFASKTVNGNPITNFMGIPFGKPPVGPRRFSKPEFADPWSEVLNAKTVVQCLQYDFFMAKAVVGQEDCLVLNVYVPGNGKPKKDGSLLPVMVFIHGGAFFLGSGSPDFYGPERFLDYDVILVTVNYRLGPLGFMSTSNDDMPANLGLWDQNLGLKWVHKHIRDFGGNPYQVTLFGESAGAMSVIYHYLSPQSKGLFHAAIAQSGTATSTYLAVNKNPVYYARSVADKVGCNPKATTQELTDCLRKIDGATIQRLTVLYPQEENNPLVFKPYIDDFSKDPFVPKDPWELIESGEFNHVPLIIGNNKDEGIISAINFVQNSKRLEDLGNRWQNELGPLYIAGREADEIDQDILELTKEVNHWAFPVHGKPTQDTVLTGLKDLASDVIFNAIGSITARKIAQKSQSPVYEYAYNHKGTIGFSEIIAMPPWKATLKYLGQFIGLNLFTPQLGVGHGDEMFMLFKFNKIPIESVYTTADKATSKNILKLWTDFAKSGDPTPNKNTVQWTRLSSTSNHRMEIGSGYLRMALDPKLEKRVDFWSKIWSKMPTYQRLWSSKSWKNPLLYGPTNKLKSRYSESREEL